MKCVGTLLCFGLLLCYVVIVSSKVTGDLSKQPEDVARKHFASKGFPRNKKVDELLQRGMHKSNPTSGYAAEWEYLPNAGGVEPTEVDGRKRAANEKGKNLMKDNNSKNENSDKNVMEGSFPTLRIGPGNWLDANGFWWIFGGKGPQQNKYDVGHEKNIKGIKFLNDLWLHKEMDFHHSSPYWKLIHNGEKRDKSDMSSFPDNLGFPLLCGSNRFSQLAVFGGIKNPQVGKDDRAKSSQMTNEQMNEDEELIIQREKEDRDEYESFSSPKHKSIVQKESKGVGFLDDSAVWLFQIDEKVKRIIYSGEKLEHEYAGDRKSPQAERKCTGKDAEAKGSCNIEDEEIMESTAPWTSYVCCDACLPSETGLKIDSCPRFRNQPIVWCGEDSIMGLEFKFRSKKVGEDSNSHAALLSYQKDEEENKTAQDYFVKGSREVEEERTEAVLVEGKAFTEEKDGQKFLSPYRKNEESRRTASLLAERKHEFDKGFKIQDPLEDVMKSTTEVNNKINALKLNVKEERERSGQNFVFLWKFSIEEKEWENIGEVKIKMDETLAEAMKAFQRGVCRSVSTDRGFVYVFCPKETNKEFGNVLLFDPVRSTMHGLGTIQLNNGLENDRAWELGKSIFHAVESHNQTVILLAYHKLLDLWIHDHSTQKLHAVQNVWKGSSLQEFQHVKSFYKLILSMPTSYTRRQAVVYTNFTFYMENPRSELSSFEDSSFLGTFLITILADKDVFLPQRDAPPVVGLNVPSISGNISMMKVVSNLTRENRAEATEDTHPQQNPSLNSNLARKLVSNEENETNIMKPLALTILSTTSNQSNNKANQVNPSETMNSYSPTVLNLSSILAKFSLSSERPTVPAKAQQMGPSDPFSVNVHHADIKSKAQNKSSVAAKSMDSPGIKTDLYSAKAFYSINTNDRAHKMYKPEEPFASVNSYKYSTMLSSFFNPNKSYDIGRNENEESLNFLNATFATQIESTLSKNLHLLSNLSIRSINVQGGKQQRQQWQNKSHYFQKNFEEARRAAGSSLIAKAPRYSSNFIPSKQKNEFEKKRKKGEENIGKSKKRILGIKGPSLYSQGWTSRVVRRKGVNLSFGSLRKNNESHADGAMYDESSKWLFPPSMKKDRRDQTLESTNGSTGSTSENNDMDATGDENNLELSERKYNRSATTTNVASADNHKHELKKTENRKLSVHLNDSDKGILQSIETVIKNESGNTIENSVWNNNRMRENAFNFFTATFSSSFSPLMSTHDDPFNAARVITRKIKPDSSHSFSHNHETGEKGELSRITVASRPLAPLSKSNSYNEKRSYVTKHGLERESGFNAQPGALKDGSFHRSSSPISHRDSENYNNRLPEIIEIEKSTSKALAAASSFSTTSQTLLSSTTSIFSDPPDKTIIDEEKSVSFLNDDHSHEPWSSFQKDNDKFKLHAPAMTNGQWTINSDRHHESEQLSSNSNGYSLSSFSTYSSMIFFAISLSIFATVALIVFVRRCVICPSSSQETLLKQPSPITYSVMPDDFAFHAPIM